MPRITKEELLKLQEKLKTDEEIGKKFGISRQAIHQLRLNYGISSIKDKFKDRNQDIVNMYEAGKSAIFISQKTGLSITQTYRILRKFNVEFRKTK